jgi:hypothetical protein
MLLLLSSWKKQQQLQRSAVWREIDRRRRDESTYTTPISFCEKQPKPRRDDARTDNDIWNPFLETFYRELLFRQDPIELEQHSVVSQWYHALVVHGTVTYEDFWQRYYYRTNYERVYMELLEQNEQDQQQRDDDTLPKQQRVSERVVRNIQSILWKNQGGGAPTCSTTTSTLDDTVDDDDDNERQPEEIVTFEELEESDSPNSPSSSFPHRILSSQRKEIIAETTQSDRLTNNPSVLFSTSMRGSPNDVDFKPSTTNSVQNTTDEHSSTPTAKQADSSCWSSTGTKETPIVDRVSETEDDPAAADQHRKEDDHGDRSSKDDHNDWTLESIQATTLSDKKMIVPPTTIVETATSSRTRFFHHFQPRVASRCRLVLLSFLLSVSVLVFIMFFRCTWMLHDIAPPDTDIPRKNSGASSFLPNSMDLDSSNTLINPFIGPFQKTKPKKDLDASCAAKKTSTTILESTPITTSTTMWWYSDSYSTYSYNIRWKVVEQPYSLSQTFSRRTTSTLDWFYEPTTALQSPSKKKKYSSSPDTSSSSSSWYHHYYYYDFWPQTRQRPLVPSTQPTLSSFFVLPEQAQQSKKQQRRWLLLF